ncbi:MAG: hypothetical protein ACI906_002842 [Candidatus Latescibacterota bacterium]|jgi:hypothetical protein
MTDHTALIQLAQRLLTESTGRSIKLKNPEKLNSQHIVLRCQLDPTSSDISSVVLKQVTTTQFNNPDGPADESHRFLNEWASLEFLSSLPGENHYGPRLLASNREDSLIILEDFGAHETVQDLLLGNNRDATTTGMEAIGRFLGQMHAATYGRGDEFAAIQSHRNAASPHSDSTRDIREQSEAFQNCFAALQITPATGFWEALENIERSIHSPGPFHTFIHADAGPHNFLYIDGTVQLLDYEFGAYGHGLLDVVSARLGFPHTSKVQSVPLEAARQLERAYQRELAHVIPQITDNALFEQEIVDACAHWALSRWVGYWTWYFKECFEIDEEAMNKKMEISTEEAQTMRSRTLTLYQSFIQFSQMTNHQLPIAETLQSYTRILQQKWPELEVMPIYPGLRGNDT